jgi:8-oxo-dGTP pyrophosphatase MutT (NUDIX family)
MLKFLNMKEEFIKKKIQVVVIAEDSALFLEFNSKSKNGPQGFQNITGSVENGESFEEAAVRELQEEIGVKCSQLSDLKMEFLFNDRWKNKCKEKVFLCLLDKKPAIVLSEEHKSYKWILLSKVQKSDYTFPSNFEALLNSQKSISMRTCQ